MKITLYKPGESRVINKFLWFPLCLCYGAVGYKKPVWRWMEYAKIRQKCIGSVFLFVMWKNMAWEFDKFEEEEIEH